MLSRIVLFIITLIGFTSTSTALSAMSRFSLRQAINVPGLKIVSRVIAQPSIALPKIELSNLRDINLDDLQQRGIRCVVFDKDNTLTETYQNDLHPSVSAIVQETKEKFPKAVAILSNSVGTEDDINHEGAKLTEKSMGIPVIVHKQKKPACLEEVLFHFSQSLGTPVQPHEICVVGDRLLTDVVFANRYGLLSVLVSPINAFKDHPIATLLRFMERQLLLPLVKMLIQRKR